MRVLRLGIVALVSTVAAFIIAGRPGRSSVAAQGQDYPEWPLPTADRAYGGLDGRHLHGYVVEQAMLARRYRDNGHSQFWGRITGTSGDTEDQQWLVDKFKQAGLTDIHIQPIDMPPQWIANSWSASVTSGEKTLPLSSAQVTYRTPKTQGDGLEVEAVYAGLGTDADFQGRDVRGKAVFIFSMPKPGPSAGQLGALKRSEQLGAAAIFNVVGLPENMKFQSYDVGTHVPTFSLGTEDGEAVRNMISQAGTGNPPRVKIRVDAGNSPDLTKTGLVFGTLPGMTEETIYIIAHRDGWFDAANDNATGVATMIGLAEYFARVPKNSRRRTIIFIGTDGHHQIIPGGFGREWLAAHRAELFTKTALMINSEHTSCVATYPITNAYIPVEWYAGGATRPKLEEIARRAFLEFGLTTWMKPNTTPPGGDMLRFYWFLPGLVAQSNDFLYFHTDQDSPEHIPWTGLEAATRAYAKIIDEVNKIDLKDLQRPPEPDPHPPGTPKGYM